MTTRKRDALDGDSVEKTSITLVISSLSNGGAERVTCNLANYLDKKGYAVDIITLSESKNAYHINDEISEVCLLKNAERRNVIINNMIRLKRLKRYIREHSEVSCYVAMLSTPSFMLTFFKKYIDGDIIVSERNNPKSYGLIKKMMMKCATKRCDGLVVQTKEVSEYYNEIKNKMIIPNAINKDVDMPKRGHTKKKIVAVGRLEKQKNYPMMIRSFAGFNNKHPDYKLEIYGKGSQEKMLKKMVDRYGLTDKVLFKGYIGNVSKEIVNATCFVMSSNYEGIPNALIEAMCIGLPCISTDTDGGGVRELIKNNENGIIVRKNEVEDMTVAMLRIVDDKVLQDKISKNARNLKKELDPDLIYGKWLWFIEKGVKDDRS